MIDKEDFEFIVRFDSNNPAERERILNSPAEKIECIRTLMTIMSKVSKESTLQYTVTLIDDLLQENKSRVELFHLYSRKYKESVYGSFIQKLYLQDAFLVNQVSRIITKLACWSTDLMPDKELKDYFLWLKEQIAEKVTLFARRDFVYKNLLLFLFHIFQRILTKILCVAVCKCCSELIITVWRSINWAALKA